MIGKYMESAPDSEARAEEAFRRALEINPRLSVAHKFYAHLEADIGEAQRALVRLLGQAVRHRNDSELFAGLVHACRYCGLNEASVAAHDEARRLDPNVPTSVEQTLLMAGDVDRLLSLHPPLVVAGADDGIRVIGLGLTGRREEARRALHDMRRVPRIAAFRAWTECLIAWLERRPADLLAGLAALGGIKIQDDPEAMFQEGWLLCDAGEYGEGLAHLERAVDKGYYPVATLSAWPQFEAIRNDASFTALVRKAREGRMRALSAFRETGGERLLGPVA